ncbi:MAG: hypothetical protein JRE28_13395 [Deltaproteobacteria bacterium]|nr:hypothetical protein [Deltaproteobacteria bacterium]
MNIEDMLFGQDQKWTGGVKSSASIIKFMAYIIPEAVEKTLDLTNKLKLDLAAGRCQLPPQAEKNVVFYFLFYQWAVMNSVWSHPPKPKFSEHVRAEIQTRRYLIGASMRQLSAKGAAAFENDEKSAHAFAAQLYSWFEDHAKPYLQRSRQHYEFGPRPIDPDVVPFKENIAVLWCMEKLEDCLDVNKATKSKVWKNTYETMKFDSVKGRALIIDLEVDELFGQ